MSDIPREHLRRDRTNASGYVCPTENQAIYMADRGIQYKYTAPTRKKPVETLRPVNPPQPKPKNPPPQPKPKDENLKRARQLYTALCSIAGMMDFTITNVELKCKGDPSHYQNIGEKRSIVRIEEEVML